MQTDTTWSRALLSRSYTKDFVGTTTKVLCPPFEKDSKIVLSIFNRRGTVYADVDTDYSINMQIFVNNYWIVCCNRTIANQRTNKSIVIDKFLEFQKIHAKKLLSYPVCLNWLPNFFGAFTLTKRIGELAAANAELAARQAARPNELAVPRLQQVT